MEMCEHEDFKTRAWDRLFTWAGWRCKCGAMFSDSQRLYTAAEVAKIAQRWKDTASTGSTRTNAERDMLQRWPEVLSAISKLPENSCHET